MESQFSLSTLKQKLISNYFIKFKNTLDIIFVLESHDSLEFSGKFDTIHRVDLRISDTGNLLGSDWVKVAHELNIPDSDINIIKSEYPDNNGN